MGSEVDVRDHSRFQEFSKRGHGRMPEQKVGEGVGKNVEVRDFERLQLPLSPPLSPCNTPPTPYTHRHTHTGSCLARKTQEDCRQAVRDAGKGSSNPRKIWSRPSSLEGSWAG